MNFISGVYLLLFPAAAAVCPFLKPSARRLLLLAVSWFFYLYAGRWAFGILLMVTAVSWRCALRVESEGDRRRKRKALAAGVGTILAVLLFFKYGDLLWQSFVSARAGAYWPGFKFNWVIPAGLSFYTFQSIGYCADVYRGRIRAERSFWKYALFVSFFPQLVAGPIEKAESLMPDLSCEKPADAGDIRKGVWLLARGYFKKLAAADFLAVYVDQVFAGGRLAGYAGKGPVFLAAAVLFSFQIYADFSGYSDIAMGSARCLGIRLSENFRLPYLSGSLRDFWRRWHITLNRWFTEQVYIPLGGKRRGRTRQCLLILLVFGLSGIWHGAAPHFLVWGAVHGALVLTENALERIRLMAGSLAARTETAGSATRLPAAWSAIRTMLVFLLVSLGWIWFRAGSVGEAIAIFRCLPFGWENAWHELVRFAHLHTAACARILLIPLGLYLVDTMDNPAGEQGIFLCWLLAVLTVAAAAAAAAQGQTNAFIYFQF